MSAAAIILCLFVLLYLYLNINEIYDTPIVKHPCDICEESYKQKCSTDFSEIYQLPNQEKESWTERMENHSENMNTKHQTKQ